MGEMIDAEILLIFGCIAVPIDVGSLVVLYRRRRRADDSLSKEGKLLQQSDAAAAQPDLNVHSAIAHVLTDCLRTLASISVAIVTFYAPSTGSDVDMVSTVVISALTLMMAGFIVYELYHEA